MKKEADKAHVPKWAPGLKDGSIGPSAIQNSLDGDDNENEEAGLSLVLAWYDAVLARPSVVASGRTAEEVITTIEAILAHMS